MLVLGSLKLGHHYSGVRSRHWRRQINGMSVTALFFKQWPANLLLMIKIWLTYLSLCVSLSFPYIVSLPPLFILQSKAIGKPCAAIRDLLECWIDSGAWLQPLISGHAQSRPFDSWQWTDDSQARLITAN